MNLACATEVFQDLQGSGHCEIIYTGVRAHTPHTYTHTHTSLPPIPWRTSDSQSTAGFSELTLVKISRSLYCPRRGRIPPSPFTAAWKCHLFISTPRHPPLELLYPPPKAAIFSLFFSSFVSSQMSTRPGPAYGDFHIKSAKYGGLTWR